jgi:glutaminase
MMATAAATLANGGINPLTGERVLSAREVRHALATMATAGLYDGSGRWMFAIGMPAKSGVGGGLLVVAPGVGGFATVSEALNEEFNPTRGIAFFQGLSMRFPNLHAYAPGSGADPNHSLRPTKACDLESSTIELQPGMYVPEGWPEDDLGQQYNHRG